MKFLDLTNKNMIDGISDQIELERLWLDDNKIEFIPKDIAKLTNLKHLSVYKNNLKEIPPVIFSMQQLESINFSANQIIIVPHEISDLKNLTVLDIQHNKIKNIPASIGKLTKLKFLYLGGNNLQDLPESFENLTQLRYLNLTYNNFKRLPDIVTKLQNLVELKLYNNKIEFLSDTIVNLPNLLYLELRSNLISSLPTSIGKLKSIRSIDLRENKLETIPESILELENLEKLDLRLNKELVIPAWIKELEQRNCIVYYIKEKRMTHLIYLIGRSGTGKYTIAKELAKGAYVIVDNQLINNPIFSLLKTDDLNSSLTVPREAWNAIGKIRDIVFEFMASEQSNNYILTNELFDDDEGDHRLFNQVKNLIVKRGSIFLPVKLLISKEENARRITSPGRAERYKSTKIDEKDKTRKLIEVDHPNLLEIDVSTLSAKEVAKIILNRLNEMGIDYA